MLCYFWPQKKSMKTSTGHFLQSIFLLATFAVSCEKPQQGIAVTSISFDKSSITLTVGESELLKVTVLPENATDKNYSFSSSDPSVATVSENGNVEAKKAGSATVTATTANGLVKAECAVTVKAKYVPAKSVKVTGPDGKERGTLKIGQQVQLGATLLPENSTDTVCSWTTVTDCAKVDENGLVTALKTGNCVIRAHVTETCFGEYYLEIPRVNVESFKIVDRNGNTSGEGFVCDTVQLVPVITPDDVTEKYVTWSSSDEYTATVDHNGLVTLHRVGKVTITGVVNGNAVDRAEATYSMTISQIDVTSIEVVPATLTLIENRDFNLEAIVYPENASNFSVRWFSGNNDIARVNSETGQVMALKAGKTKIYASSQDGNNVSGYCELTVEPDPTLKGISLESDVLTLEVGSSKTLQVAFNPPYASNKNVTWSSSDNTVATVSDGTVTGVGEGTATVTVTSQEGGFTAQCSVTVMKDLPEGTKFLYMCGGSLYLNGEIYANHVNDYAVDDRDIYYCYYFNSGDDGFFRNRQKIFQYTDFVASSDILMAMTAVSGKIYLCLVDRGHHNQRLKIVDSASGNVKTVELSGDAGNWSEDYRISVSNDGVAYVSATVTNSYSEMSSVMWEVAPSGKCSKTEFFTSLPNSSWGIENTYVCDLEVSASGDVYALVYKKEYVENPYSRAATYSTTLFKNGKAVRTFEKCGENPPYCISCSSDNVYVMLQNKDDRKIYIYKNDDCIYPELGIATTGYGKDKLMVAHKNESDLYYVIKDESKYFVYKNGDKLFTHNLEKSWDMISKLSLMY